MAAPGVTPILLHSRAEDIQKITVTHQVGGFYLTLKEFLDATKVVNGDVTGHGLPCRVANVAAYFNKPEDMKSYPEHVIARASLGLTQNDLDWMSYTFESNDDEDHPVRQFVKKLLAECTIKDETFIKEHCFTFQFCCEHEYCKRFHKHGVTKLRTSCCSLEECKSPFNSYQQATSLNKPVHLLFDLTE